MSDDEIAKRCGLKVSDVRAVLNKLHEYGITTYVRERDKDTGWFSYNWTVDLIKLYEVMEKRQEKIEKRDEEALAYERSYTFYVCGNAECTRSAQRVPESDAVLTAYVCDRCGDHLSIFDNAEIIKSIEKKLSEKINLEDSFAKAVRVSVRETPHKKPTKKRPSLKTKKLKIKKLMKTKKAKKTKKLKIKIKLKTKKKAIKATRRKNPGVREHKKKSKAKKR